MLVLKPVRELSSKGEEYCIEKCLGGVNGSGRLVWTPLREVFVESISGGKPSQFYVDYYFYPKASNSRSRLFLLKLKLQGKIVDVEPLRNTSILSPEHLDPSIIVSELHNVYREVKAKVNQLYMELSLIPRRKRSERRAKRAEIAAHEILLEIVRKILYNPEKPEVHTIRTGKTIWAPIIIAKTSDRSGEEVEDQVVVCQAYGKLRIDKAYTYAGSIDERIREEYMKILEIPQHIYK